MVNPGSSAHRHQARSKADPARPHHRMVTLAQSSPGDRSACAPQSKTATVMLRLPRGPMSETGLGRVKTPTCSLRVEIPSRFRQLENQKYLRPLLGEDDRENNSAHSWLAHVFTQPGSKGDVRWCPD